MHHVFRNSTGALHVRSLFDYLHARPRRSNSSWATAYVNQGEGNFYVQVVASTDLVSARRLSRPDRRPFGCRQFHFVGPDESRRAFTEEHLSADEYEKCRDLFHGAGLNIDDYRFETIKRRIPACLRAVRVDSLAGARAAVQRRPELLKTVVDSLVIGVTSFFRDPTVFEALGHTVIPRLLSQKKGPRIWSVGCSEGQELYSAAMLLAERGGLQRPTLLGTDCRPDTLAHAREGCYDHFSLRTLPNLFLSRYFQNEGNTWRIHPYLRAVSQWRAGNALKTPEPGAWDLILCRNMSIYLQPASATRLWQILENCLTPGGYLVLGKAERPLGTAKLSPVSPCIFRRNGS